MHVLIIPSWYPGNSVEVRGSFFREQAIALHKNGCKVGVIYPQLRSIKKWKSILTGLHCLNVEQDEGVETYRSHGMNWFPRTVVPFSKLFTWHSRRLFKNYIKKNGLPDVIHAHSLLYAGQVAAEIKNIYGVPFIITEHSTAFARNMVSPKALLIAKNASLNANRRFAVSKEFAKLLDKMIGEKSLNWEEMPNIVNEKFYEYKLPIKKNDGNFYFINVALMDKKKKQENILYAFARISKKYQNTRLILGGDGPERNSLEKIADDLKISEKVEFTGLLSREQVMTQMASADAFVLSSSYETFGVVVIEALALGKPVIATQCGGPESILRKEDGLLIPVDDVNALVNAMQQMLENYHEYDSAEIREACIDRYSETAITTQLKQAYTKIISDHRQISQSSQLEKNSSSIS